MEIMAQVGRSGRIVLPARLRRALGIQPGDEIILRIEEGTIRLIPLNQAVSMAQQAVRKYTPAGTSLVDGLLQARREETGRE